LAEWLGNNGHDVVEAQTLGPDPGDRALLELAESENRVLITMDKDFGELIYLRRVSHAGLIRLPDVRVARRIEMIKELIDQYSDALEDRAIVTIQGGRVRVSRSPSF
jgi:predicted nuclease of predicted toxin-antitoxin system